MNPFVRTGPMKKPTLHSPMQLLWFAVKSFYHTPRLTESVTKINLAYSNDCYTRFASPHNVQSRTEGVINVKLITKNWEDLIRFAGSLKLGHLKAEGVARILQVRDRPTTLSKALMHLGRLIKTLHILNYIDDEEFRRKVLVQLNRQEFRHKLARKIYHGERGEVRNALRQGQEDQLGSLGLALNAVIHWNAIYMQAALAKLTTDGQIIDPSDIARLSPILWRHINFLGRYDIALPESVAYGGLRPLRDPTFEWDL